MTNKTPRVVQMPLRQPLLLGNVMHPLWVRFFEHLSDTTNENKLFSIRKIAGDIGDLTEEVLEIDSSITDVSQLIDAINQTLLGVDTNISDLQSAVTSIQSQLSAINNALSDLDVRVTALENAP